ncbi:MAG: DMT family transporter [Planctomycetota bacterium]|jgi:drug/metabolite transporter (DMT)-like permease|nr:DMT family transporter [Planctomycetota bacterium]
MRAALIKLHISIILAGFTGIFGKLIRLDETPLVWWRLLLALMVMLPALRLAGALPPPSAPALAALFGVGGLQCLHWLLFYASIRLSTVSVALVCISLMGFFSALFSPWILGAKWSLREFVYSGLSLAGVILIFHFDSRYRLGIAVGVVSSAVASLFVVCTKKISGRHPPGALFFYQILGGWLILTVFVPFYLAARQWAWQWPDKRDLAYLALLSIFCTVVLYIIQWQALRRVSAFTVNLSLNLEPVYSIILASLILGEARDFTPSFCAGLALILLSVALQTWRLTRAADGGNLHA